MGQPGVSDIPELLAHLDALARAAHAADDGDGELPAFFRTLHRRAAAIHAHLHPNHPADTADSPSLEARSPATLADTFRELIAAAEAAALAPSLTDYLRNAGHRLHSIVEGAPDRRIAPRQPEKGQAELHAGAGRWEVAVVESSTFGIGVHAPAPLEPDQVVRLVVAEVYGATTYDCLVSQSHPTAEWFHVGLEIFAVRI
ncbi:MAG TPA: hypothetical protein VJ985_09915 [Gammaproteobacteria bacterium]|nr:hypothetical protein [Gammaproteobacteria bacterium]